MSYTARASEDTSFRDSVEGSLVEALNGDGEVKPARLFSMRQEFSSEWHRLLFPAESEAQAARLNLTKQHFPRYLDYVWAPDDAGVLTARPLELEITGCAVFLDPSGPLAEDVDLRVNDVEPEPDPVMPELLRFDVDPPGARIRNDSGADLVLTVTDGAVAASEWRDLYVLVSYAVMD